MPGISTWTLQVSDHLANAVASLPLDLEDMGGSFASSRPGSYQAYVEQLVTDTYGKQHRYFSAIEQFAVSSATQTYREFTTGPVLRPVPTPYTPLPYSTSAGEVVLGSTSTGTDGRYRFDLGWNQWPPCRPAQQAGRASSSSKACPPDTRPSPQARPRPGRAGQVPPRSVILATAGRRLWPERLPVAWTGNGHTDIHAYGDPVAHTDCDAQPDANENSDGDRDQLADANAHADSYRTQTPTPTDTATNTADSNQHEHAHRHTHQYAYLDPDADGDQYGDAHTDTDGQPDTDPDQHCHAHADAHQHADGRAGTGLPGSRLSLPALVSARKRRSCAAPGTAAFPSARSAIPSILLFRLLTARTAPTGPIRMPPRPSR